MKEHVEDETAASNRVRLIDAAVTGKQMAVHSVSEDGLEQVAIGRIVRVSGRHVVVATSKAFESALPINAITKLDELHAPKQTEAA
jgi:hypothetical protein